MVDIYNILLSAIYEAFGTDIIYKYIIDLTIYIHIISFIVLPIKLFKKRGKKHV